MTSVETDEERKQRLRREKAEAWKNEREAKKLASTGAPAQPTSIAEAPVVEKAVAQKPVVESIVIQTEVVETSITPASPVAIKRSFLQIDETAKKPTIALSSNAPKRFKIGIFNTKSPKSDTISSDIKFGEASSSLVGIKQVTANTRQAMDVATVNANEEDSLDAFMQDVTAEVKKLNQEDLQKLKKVAKTALQDSSGANDDTKDYEANEEDEDDILAFAAKKLAKKKDLAIVDHTTIEYEPFNKDFYIEPVELTEMSNQEAQAVRESLDGIKVAGKHCPKPVTKWTHCGLPLSCLEIIKKSNFVAPTPIQAQALPAIMSGRDVIGIAKTGSGKTLAFLLPLLRHVKDQRPVGLMEGPIALIMTPTRELAMQIHKECKTFGRVLGIRSLCAYGGSPIKDQIADLKRGAEVIVCTPGRMIDLLCANSGRVTNLRRVTYMVLDEADRMFDMGFEPQVMKIVNNVRPNRQTVLFSATFPRQMEALARKILRRPLEIAVGGKSVVCQDVAQFVEVREEDTKFVRLLEILGSWFDKDKKSRVLIFVDRQDGADTLLGNLLRRGYACMSLHGGKDQMDRDSTVSDFKSGVTPMLIATSVAARGLDVKGLNLVINYDCPNHKEDFVHRVGRTGRAGHKGTAYTFITPEQERYANDIADAVRSSGATVPIGLQTLADEFKEKVKAGQAIRASSGFGGKGLERLEGARDVMKKVQKLSAGIVDEESDEETTILGDEESTIKTEIVMQQLLPGGGGGGGFKTVNSNVNNELSPIEIGNSNEFALAAKAAQEAAAQISEMNPALARAQDIVNQINNRLKAQSGVTVTSTSDPNPVYNYTDEVDINDFPQKARWRVTNKEQISQIGEISGAAITTRGLFFPPGKAVTGNERKLYLYIEGETRLSVDKARAEIARVLKEATLASMEMELKTGTSGRYSVV